MNTAPASVRAQLRRGLALVEQGHAGNGLRGETVTWARRLADGDPISREKAIKMRAWFARHGVAKLESARRLRDPTSPAAVAYLLWGGTPSIGYRRTGWRDPVAAWLQGVLKGYESRSVRRNSADAIPSGLLDGSLYKEPVYHGSNNGSFRGHGLDPSHGAEFGIFVTPRRRYAALYGNHVYAVLINLQRPLLVADKSEISPRDLTRADVERLERRGYDSIVSGGGGEIGKAHEIVLFRRQQAWIVDVA